MVDQAKRLEIAVVRPLDIVFLTSAAVFLFKGMWWWAAGCVAGVFYLGVIGSKLHPLQSAKDLAQGSVEGPAARIEQEILPNEVKQMLVLRACTRIGILLGVAGGFVSWGAFGLRWYLALTVALLLMLLISTLLKLPFRTEKSRR